VRAERGSRDGWPRGGRVETMTNTTEMTAEKAEDRMKRVRMRSWRRGTKEMDLILGPFADARLADLTRDEVDAYEALLVENDQDLYRWVSGKEQAPAPHSGMLGLIRRHHGID
jgi:antitoxin CptB